MKKKTNPSKIYSFEKKMEGQPENEQDARDAWTESATSSRAKNKRGKK